MKSIGQVMQELIERVFVVVGNCPDCGADLYQWRQNCLMVKIVVDQPVWCVGTKP